MMLGKKFDLAVAPAAVHSWSRTTTWPVPLAAGVALRLIPGSGPAAVSRSSQP